MKFGHRSQTAYATDCFTCNNYQVLKHYQKLYKKKQNKQWMLIAWQNIV